MQGVGGEHHQASLAWERWDLKASVMKLSREKSLSKAQTEEASRKATCKLERVVTASLPNAPLG